MPFLYGTENRHFREFFFHIEAPVVLDAHIEDSAHHCLLLCEGILWRTLALIRFEHRLHQDEIRRDHLNALTLLNFEPFC